MKKEILIGASLSLFLFASGCASSSDAPSNNKQSEAPQSTTYAVAKSTGSPYHCIFKIDSFFGERNDAVADVLGDDYILTETSELAPAMGNGEGALSALSFNTISVRKGEWAYSWLLAEEAGKKMDITRYEKEVSELTKKQIAFEGVGLFFNAPPADASCELITSVEIEVPSYEFKDITDMIIEQMAKEINQSYY
jgi:hypothetical protein